MKNEKIRLFGGATPVAQQLASEHPLVGSPPTCPITGEVCPTNCPNFARLVVSRTLVPDAYAVIKESAISTRRLLTMSDEPDGLLPSSQGPLGDMADTMSGLVVGLNNTLAESAGISPKSCPKNQRD